MPLADLYNPETDYSNFGSITAEGCSVVCPVGTVAVKDASGNFMGCLTPADAAQYAIDTLVPEAGSGKRLTVDGQLIGVFNATQLTDWIAAGGA